MKTFHVYLEFRLLGGKVNEERETVRASTAGDALTVAAGRWPLLDPAGVQIRWPAGYQVWEWDGSWEGLVIEGGAHHQRWAIVL